MSTAPSRADLVADQLASPPFGRRRFTADEPAVRVGITGTGKDLLLLAWSASELAREVEAGVRLLGRLGIRAGQRVANTLPGALATPGALLLGDVNEAIGALDVPLGTAETEAAARAAWELVDRVQCQILILVPETAESFFRAAPAAPRPWLVGIVWLQQPEGAVAPAVPAAFNAWERLWLAVPEVSSFVAGSCEHGLLHADAEAAVEVSSRHLVLAPSSMPAAFATGMTARRARCACRVGDVAFER